MASSKCLGQDVTIQRNAIHGGADETMQKGKSATCALDIKDRTGELPTIAWTIKEGCLEAQARLLERKLRLLFEMALEGNEDMTDILFESENGWRMRGHKCIMTVTCEYFSALFTNGMEESRRGIVKVHDCSKDTFAAVMELSYTGDISNERAAKADGGELWRIADLWGIDDLKDWLKRSLASGKSVWGGAAQQAADLGDNELVAACAEAVCSDSSMQGKATEQELQGVGSHAIAAVLEILRNQPNVSEVGFWLLERWWKANGCDGIVPIEEGSSLADLVDLGRVSISDVRESTCGYALFQHDRIRKLIERRQVGWDGWGLHCSFAEQQRIGTFSSNYYLPTHVDAFADGSVVFLDMHHNQLQVYDRAGRREMPKGRGLQRASIPGPFGVAVNRKNDQIVVTNQLENCVYVYGRDGTSIRRFGTHGSGPGQFDHPTGVAVNGEGQMIVCDSGNGRVQVFDYEGTYQTCMQLADWGDGKHRALHDVAVNQSDGNIIVISDDQKSRSARVHILNRDGVLLATCGQGVLDAPYAVCVSVGGDIVVADRECNTLVVLDARGSFLRKIKCSSFCLSVKGVAVGEDGYLYLADGSFLGHISILAPKAD